MGDLPEITDDNFQAEVIEHGDAVLVDFWAPWCPPCRVLGKVLEEIDGERDDLRVVKLNTDEHQRWAAQLGILSMPTMVLFRHGVEVQRIVGAAPKARLLRDLEPALA